MAMHIIPVDDGLPHAVTTECGCGPVLVDVAAAEGFRPAFLHSPAGADEPEADEPA